MMASASSIATSLAPTRENLSSSKHLSSSISSLNSSRQASSQTTKIYRQSSTLFLTRRLPESLSTILPVITPPSDDDDAGSGEPAPVAKASRTTRIKVWSLYLTILNAVVELDPDEGKQAFGSAEFRGLVNKVRDGDVWEEVVRNGYGGIEGDVDSDVVINLATLLLAHARSQKTNQTRLETYLAASTTPNFSHLNVPESTNGSRSPSKAGTDTPRDLNSRVKILELYTLHVLLRNNEWDYAREFITISSVLDEERREAFLQALQSLQDEQEEVKTREKEELRYQEAVRKQEERERKMREEEKSSIQQPSEHDYGVEDTPAPQSTTSVTAKSANGSTSRKTTASHPSKPIIKKPVPVPPTLATRAGNIIANFRRLVESMALGLKTNPIAILRTLTFIAAIVVVFGRRSVRERVRRMWAKVLATAGMGVKVSYI